MMMPTRNVVLTERQEELLETLVKSGRYQNASEVLRDGLRLVEQREAEDAGKLKALRAAARLGVGALDRGEFKEFRNVEDLQTYLNDLSEKVISRTAEERHMTNRGWRVRLGAAAELDFANILKWTAENFGARQSLVYRDVLVQAIGELADGPDVTGSKARDEIMPGLRTLHIARRGRRGSHFLMYRAASERTIEIVRILHDRMDLQRYVSPDDAIRNK
jgi:toxin ParE1/3/4